MTRVLSLNQKEVCFKPTFSLAVFTKTPTVEFMEQEARSAGKASTSTRNEGPVPQYGMC